MSSSRSHTLAVRRIIEQRDTRESRSGDPGIQDNQCSSYKASKNSPEQSGPAVNLCRKSVPSTQQISPVRFGMITTNVRLWNSRGLFGNSTDVEEKYNDPRSPHREHTNPAKPQKIDELQEDAVVAEIKQDSFEAAFHTDRLSVGTGVPLLPNDANAVPPAERRIDSASPLEIRDLTLHIIFRLLEPRDVWINARGTCTTSRRWIQSPRESTKQDANGVRIKQLLRPWFAGYMSDQVGISWEKLEDAPYEMPYVVASKWPKFVTVFERIASGYQEKFEFVDIVRSQLVLIDLDLDRFPPVDLQPQQQGAVCLHDAFIDFCCGDDDIARESLKLLEWSLPPSVLLGELLRCQKSVTYHVQKYVRHQMSNPDAIWPYDEKALRSITLPRLAVMMGWVDVIIGIVKRGLEAVQFLISEEDYTSLQKLEFEVEQAMALHFSFADGLVLLYSGLSVSPELCFPADLREDSGQPPPPNAADEGTGIV